ncbi:MAG: hybrid sensor histidine kinase/response regulator [bacterium]|nr:hybrid sensor histidine kinase/response regulator [bacterium]
MDDTQANLDVLCELLEAEGYTISVAPSGEIALQIVERVKPDLILLDVMMPGIDGFEVCRRLKQDATTQDIPVIFITAENQTDKLVAGFEVGGVDYIAKPFQNEEVLVRVSTHLKIDRLTRELAGKNEALNQANRRVREASERKSRFLTNMVHELRTPMNAIIGFTRMVLNREGNLLSEKQRNNLGKVMKSADRLLDLVNDLLDLSKIEAGRVDVQAEWLDLQDLIVACCNEIRPLVKSGVRLDYDVQEVQEVHTDQRLLQQIVMNLLSNAAKFTESGMVCVRVTQNGDEVEISVVDTGVGIPAEALDTIFEEFEQVKGSDPQRRGTGLGLSITLLFPSPPLCRPQSCPCMFRQDGTGWPGNRSLAYLRCGRWTWICKCVGYTPGSGRTPLVWHQWHRSYSL